MQNYSSVAGYRSQQALKCEKKWLPHLKISKMMRKDCVRSEATDYELLIMNEQLFSVYIVCNVI